MKMYKISIIMPIYNVGLALKTAINSIINQTMDFENIEVILVDDCSTDNSKSIMKEFASKYDNIKCIFLDENSGSPSKPRNVGMDNASAPYLMFLDSDDELVNDSCETLYECIIQNQADIVSASYCRKFISGYYAFDDSQKYQSEIENHLALRFTVWGNIFKTELIKKNNIEFPDSLYEDGVFCIKAFTKAKKIVALPKYNSYIYTVEKEGSKSITHNIKKDSILSLINGFKHANEYLSNYNFDKQRLVDDIPLIYFMFFKFKGSTNDKLELLKHINNFEKSLNYTIKIKSKPLNILNSLVLNERYSFAIFLSTIAGILYENDSIKNFIFRKFSGIKKIEL